MFAAGGSRCVHVAWVREGLGNSGRPGPVSIQNSVLSVFSPERHLLGPWGEESPANRSEGTTGRGANPSDDGASGRREWKWSTRLEPQGLFLYPQLCLLSAGTGRENAEGGAWP